MKRGTRGNVHLLAGGLQVNARVQHPQVKPRKDRQGCPWVFRYWADQIQPDASLKAVRKYEAVGPSKAKVLSPRKRPKSSATGFSRS
jgi:hypothetical protein